jgi:hypothetical protein
MSRSDELVLNVAGGGCVIAVISDSRLRRCRCRRRRIRHSRRRRGCSEIAAHVTLGHRGIRFEAPPRRRMLERDRSPETPLLDDMGELVGEQSAPRPRVEGSFRRWNEDLTPSRHRASVLRRRKCFRLPVAPYLDIGNVGTMQPSNRRSHRVRCGLAPGCEVFVTAFTCVVDVLLTRVLGRQRRLKPERPWSAARAATYHRALQPRRRNCLGSVPVSDNIGDGLLLLHSGLRADGSAAFQRRRQGRVNGSQRRGPTPRGDHLC